MTAGLSTPSRVEGGDRTARPGGRGGPWLGRRHLPGAGWVTADRRREIQVANSDGLLVSDDQVRTRFGVSCVAVGDTGMQTGYETAALTVGFELFDEVSVEEVAELAAQPGARPSSPARPAPTGEVPVVLAGQRGHPLPRGLRSRPRGRPHRQGRVGLRGQGRRAGGEPAGDPRRRRHGRHRVGDLRRRRRGEPAAAQRPHRQGRAHRLHVGLPTRPARQGGPRRATAAARATSTCPWCG